MKRLCAVVWLALALLLLSVSPARGVASSAAPATNTPKPPARPTLVGHNRLERIPLGIPLEGGTFAPPLATTLPPPPPVPTTTSPTPTSVSLVSDALDDDSIEFHRHEFQRFTSQIAELEAQLDVDEKELQAVNDAISVQWGVFEEQFDSVTQSSLPSPRGARTRNLRCMGWKKTSMCRWKGKRDHTGDKSCFAPIVESNSVGFCVVRDEDTDEYFRVMRSDCAAIAPKAYMSCRYAHAFANFPATIERDVLDNEDHEHDDPETTADVATNAASGIVVLLHPSQAKSAEKLVLALRSLGCQLPIELWSIDDTSPLDVMVTKLSTADAMVTTRLVNLRINWYDARVHAITHSQFAQVLYLDIDTVPLRDPTYLFALPEFLETGALFWPDLFHPATTDSNIQRTSLLWEYLDMPFIDMFEQDDRQLLVRRDTLVAKRGLRLVDLFATYSPNLFNILNLVKDAKDYFRLAWLKARIPFTMVDVPPSIGGGEAPNEPYKMCGSHVVQHDPSGNRLFLHRQRDAITSAAHDTFPFLQSFDWQRDALRAKIAGRLSQKEMMRAYQVTTFRPNEKETPRCYGFVNNIDPSTEGRISTTQWRSGQYATAAIERRER